MSAALWITWYDLPDAVRDAHFLGHEDNHPERLAWSDRVVPLLVHAPGSPTVATRAWPPLK